MGLLLLIIVLGYFTFSQSKVFATNNDDWWIDVAQAISPTSIPVILPTPTPIATEGVLFTPTPTFTPTSEGPLQLQVLGDTPVNVRAQADINSEQLGTIRPEETYTVIGRLFLWYQIVFDSSPSGRGWVFGDLVEILGDEAEVPDLSVATRVPANNTVDSGSNTDNINPSSEIGLTATANARIIEPPISNNGSSSTGDQNVGGALPTYTYPPNLPSFIPSSIVESEEATLIPENDSPQLGGDSGGVAPILPIVILGLAGLIGMLISSFRR